MDSFIDVSQWQGDIRWGLVRSAHRAVYIRHSDSTRKDDRYHYYIGGATQAGMICGLYHYARPEHDSFRSCIKAVADDAKWTDMVWALDIECTPIRDYKHTLHQILWVIDTYKPVIYTGMGYLSRFLYHDRGMYTDLIAGINRSHALWWAQYTMASKPTVPSSLIPWTAWQYRAIAYPKYGIPAGSCPGVVGPVDMNWCTSIDSLRQTPRGKTI